MDKQVIWGKWFALSLGGLIPDMGDPMAAPDAPTKEADPTAPVLPLGF